MVLKKYLVKSDQGPYLNVNEDNFLIDLNSKLFMIIDGFGGSGIGDKYSDDLKELVKSFYTRVGGDADSTMPYFYSHKYLLEGNALINAYHHCHREIIERNNKSEMSKKGGASLLSCVLVDSVMTFVSTGNCMALLARNGENLQIIQPDNFDFLAVESIKGVQKSFPLSGIGLFEDLHIQVKELKVQPDDRVLLMTDGIYSALSSVEFKYLIENIGKDEENALVPFFNLSNQRGNLDNQTMMLLNF